MRTALVTGATGLLGSYIVEQLLADGWRVRALVREPAAAAWLGARGVELAAGDVRDGEAVRRAAAACAVVFHAAAVIGPSDDTARFHDVNVLGTAAAIDAAAGAGARLVHVSSTSVYGDARWAGGPADETVMLPALPAADAYGRSKQESERVVLAAHEAGRLWATVVRPPMMYGRRDRQFIPRVAPVMMRGLFPLIGGGRTTLPLAFAGNVATGAIAAACSDIAGGRAYNLTNDFEVTTADLAQHGAAGLGRRVLAPSIPHALGWVGLRTLAAALRAGGRADLARRTGGTFATLTHDNPFTSERARRELGWAPQVRPSVALPDAFRWWRAHHIEGAART